MKQLKSENNRVWAGGSNAWSRVPQDALHYDTRTRKKPSPKSQWHASLQHTAGISRSQRIGMTDSKSLTTGLGLGQADIPVYSEYSL